MKDVYEVILLTAKIGQVRTVDQMGKSRGTMDIPNDTTLKKSIVLSLVLALLAMAALSAQDLQTSEVPESFTEGLLETYPSAKDIEWEKKGTDYKVEFEVGRMEHEIWFSKNGETVRVQKDITKSLMPKTLVDAINANYPDYTIDSVESTEKNGQTTYEVELEKGWDKGLKITFTVNGKVLNVKED